MSLPNIAYSAMLVLKGHSRGSRPWARFIGGHKIPQIKTGTNTANTNLCADLLCGGRRPFFTTWKPCGHRGSDSSASLLFRRVHSGCPHAQPRLRSGTRPLLQLLAEPPFTTVPLAALPTSRWRQSGKQLTTQARGHPWHPWCPRRPRRPPATAPRRQRGRERRRWPSRQTGRDPRPPPHRLVVVVPLLRGPRNVPRGTSRGSSSFRISRVS